MLYTDRNQTTSMECNIPPFGSYTVRNWIHLLHITEDTVTDTRSTNLHSLNILCPQTSVQDDRQHFCSVQWTTNGQMAWMTQCLSHHLQYGIVSVFAVIVLFAFLTQISGISISPNLRNQRPQISIAFIPFKQLLVTVCRDIQILMRSVTFIEDKCLHVLRQLNVS